MRVRTHTFTYPHARAHPQMCPYSNRRARPQLSPSIPGLHCIGRYWACLKELGLCDKADADLIEKKLKVPKIQVTKQYAIRVWRSQAPLARCSLYMKVAIKVSPS